jgi:hypothetical protein
MRSRLSQSKPAPHFDRGAWTDESGAKHSGCNCASDRRGASNHHAPEKRSAMVHRYEIIIITKSSRSGSAMRLDCIAIVLLSLD